MCGICGISSLSVTEELNRTRASARLFVSISADPQQAIRQMEDGLRVRLFERDRRLGPPLSAPPENWIWI